MISSRLQIIPTISSKWYGAELKFKPSEEAKICLECDLPDCNKIDCKRYQEEMRKLRRKHDATAAKNYRKTFL